MSKDKGPNQSEIQEQKRRELLNQVNNLNVAVTDFGGRTTQAQPERLIFDVGSKETAKEIVEKVQAQGWDRFSIQGDEYEKRGIWFEASVRGLRVDGYVPSKIDQRRLVEVNEFIKSGRAKDGTRSVAEVRNDYEKRVIPSLESFVKEIAEAREKDLQRIRGSGATDTVIAKHAAKWNQALDSAREVLEEARDTKNELSRMKSSEVITVQVEVGSGIAQVRFNEAERTRQREKELWQKRQLTRSISFNRSR